MPPANNIIPYLLQSASRHGIDPNAAIAVARGEGGLANRSGDIGDLAGGGSYGPFQLYAQGALPSQYRGRPAAADQWAWSPQGVDYAIRKMAEAGAGGLRGRAAVEAIIRKFERPADPDKSVALALSRLGGSVDAGAGPSGALAGRGASQSPAPQGDLVDQLLSAFQQKGSARTWAMLNASAPSFPAADPVGGGQAQPMPPAGVGSGPAGGSGAQAMISLIERAKGMGLAVRENPYVDPVDPVHTKGSHHYQTFPGTYNGRTVGRGIDVSGDPAKLKAYFSYVAQAYPQIAELIYDQMGSIFDGKRSRRPYGGHGSHVHVGL
jgi:hypothetical protein